MVKYCLNKLKFHLVVEEDRGNTWKKNQEQKLAVFLASFFRGLSFYNADCIDFLQIVRLYIHIYILWARQHDLSHQQRPPNHRQRRCVLHPKIPQMILQGGDLPAYVCRQIHLLRLFSLV
jgi:hypothetical protein